MADLPYQSLYRRYRPQRFAELKGQDHVSLALRNAVRSGRVSHAYLFSGPRGTGKTSTARILAKALNCEDLRDGEPCGACTSCVQVQLGSSLDVHELDAASNNGVDAMRDLVSRAALGTPGRWKVYIVDEVHMLSAAASNALLKTLEEPPGHVVFVLATTDPQKVLPTIRSRTQHFEFRLIRPEVLAELLPEVNAHAGLGVAADAIDLVVRRGSGSARDALSVLDQVAAAGSVDDETSFTDEMVEAVADGDVGRALGAVAEGCAAGRDPRRLAEELLGHLRNAFLASMARNLLDVPDAVAERVEDQARRLGRARLTRSLETIGDALMDMREALDPRVSLEVALVRIASSDVDPSPAALLERIERLERALAGQAAAPAVAQAKEAVADDPPKAASGGAAGSARAALGAVRGKARAEKPAAKAAKSAPPAPVVAPAPSSGSFPTRDDLTAAWADEVFPKLPQRARARFRGVGRWIKGPEGVATYALPNEHHRNYCEEVRADVEAALSERFGVRVLVKLIVEAPDDAPAADRADDVEEMVDPTELKDAPPGLASPEDRLKQAFPGAEEVSTRE